MDTRKERGRAGREEEKKGRMEAGIQENPEGFPLCISWTT